MLAKVSNDIQDKQDMITCISLPSYVTGPPKNNNSTDMFLQRNDTVF